MKNQHIKSILFGFAAGTLFFAVMVGGGALWRSVRAAVSGVITINGRVTGVTAPIGGSDAGNKSYIDAAGTKTPQFQTFTANGTWTLPSGVTMVWVTMCGGGNAGNTNAGNVGGNGGDAGQCYLHYPVSVSGNVAVIIGAGGVTGSINGGNTSFGSLTAFGGGGGGGGAGGASGALTYTSLSTNLFNQGNNGNNGGSSGGGAGGSGGIGSSDGSGGFGGGGGGGGGYAGAGGAGGTGGAGGNGRGYGSGGGGGGGAEGYIFPGNGTAGIVIVEWWQ